MENFYCYLRNILRASQLTTPLNNYDLVLDIRPNERQVGRKQWSYYYACHETRCLFWLETYDATKLTSVLYGVKSPAHISALHLSSSTHSLFPLIQYAGHLLEYLYWCVSCLLLDSYVKH